MKDDVPVASAQPNTVSPGNMVPGDLAKLMATKPVRTIVWCNTGEHIQ